MIVLIYQDINNWDDWWSIHKKILDPLKAQVKVEEKFFILQSTICVFFSFFLVGVLSKNS